jgi:hypothetical protein
MISITWRLGIGIITKTLKSTGNGSNKNFARKHKERTNYHQELVVASFVM